MRHLRRVIILGVVTPNRKRMAMMPCALIFLAAETLGSENIPSLDKVIQISRQSARHMMPRDNTNSTLLAERKLLVAGGRWQAGVALGYWQAGAARCLLHHHQRCEDHGGRGLIQTIVNDAKA